MLVISQLARFTTAERHQINLGGASISSFVGIGNGKRDKIAFRRNLRIADAPHLQQIVNRKAAFLGHSG
jgi:hypothetical protein